MMNEQYDNSDRNDTNDKSGSKLNFDLLPTMLKQVTDCYTDAKDQLLMLMGAITVISGVLPNVFCKYGDQTLYSNLFLYVVGKASSGKGKLVKLKELISPIQKHLALNGVVQDNVEENLQHLKLNLKECLMTPKQLLIPGNITNAGLLQLLNENGGEGIFFETEGDTIANANKSEHGKFSDSWRKAFHHEPISSYRKGADSKGELIYIDEPKLSILISSTPKQLQRVFSSTEDGLFSRFTFVETEPKDEFINVFKSNEGGDINKAVSESSAMLHDLYLTLAKSRVEFRLTDEQQIDFVKYFNKVKAMYVHFVHEDLDSSINRVGCVFVRIAMILTTIRTAENGNLPEVVYCSQEDYEFTKKLTDELLRALRNVFKSLPRVELIGLSSQKVSLYLSLADTFTTSEAVEIGERFELSERSTKRFLNSDCFERVKQGHYRKKAA